MPNNSTPHVDHDLVTRLQAANAKLSEMNRWASIHASHLKAVEDALNLAADGNFAGLSEAKKKLEAMRQWGSVHESHLRPLDAALDAYAEMATAQRDDTIEMNVRDMDGDVLNWAVAKILGQLHKFDARDHDPEWPCSYCLDWAQAGPIIEQQQIQLTTIHVADFAPSQAWGAFLDDGRDFAESMQAGSNPLVAAMRCFVAQKLGQMVSVPTKLVPEHLNPRPDAPRG